MDSLLIIDAMALFRESVATALRGHGFDVLTAADGRSALNALRSNQTRLVLIDVSLTGMNGLEVISAMRSDARLKAIPVIILTSDTSREYVVRGAKLGVKYYLLKSQYSIDDLVERIKHVLAESVTSNRSDAASAAPLGDGPTSIGLNGVRDKKQSLPADSAPATDGTIELKSLKPLTTRSEALERLDRAGDLPALSPTVSQVLKLTEQESSTIEQIARVIKQDYAIAIKILRLANSVAYGRGQLIETIDKAVARLGMIQIRQSMLNLSVIEHFSHPEQHHRLNLGHFWEHSIACGIIAAQLAASRSQEEGEAAFTMGLVHDIGRIVLMQEFGAAYATVLETAARLGVPVEEVESRLLILNHAEAMDRLLHSWKFPKELIDPVTFHHLSVADARRTTPKRCTEVITLALADRLCHALLIGDSSNPVLYPIHEHCTALRIEPDVIAQIEDASFERTQDLKLALLAESNIEAWVPFRSSVRQQLRTPVRPLVVCDQPRVDSVRLFCDQIRSDAEGPPNIAIVHAYARGAHNRLYQRLAQAEADAGVSKLPTIVLSPQDGDHDVRQVYFDRSTVSLCMPVAVQRLTHSIKALLDAGGVTAAA